MNDYPLDLYSSLLLAIIGVVAGFLNVVAGGGSLITLPVMIFMGLPPNIANATNRIAILWQNVFAIAKFKKAGVIDSKYSLYLGLAAVPGALLGGWLAVDIKGEVFTKILSVVMLVVGALILLGSSLKQKGRSYNQGKDLWIGVLLFFFIGVYGGFIHAGVGFIIILVLDRLMQAPLAKINSVKVIVAFIYTLAVVMLFLFKNVINWQYGLTLAIGTSIGGWLGSYFSIKKGDKWIKVLLFFTIIALSVKLWFYN
ncbi:sulfite exporter TauE/SafE family protein [Hyunsoonleella sp. SJ7]|uniref:Probable membrane transporter protein n=1 Tax=Hyunsoonleella aquatilis TaxID=2762758 RepID=A0A923HCY3_9FLAO|nr:sulfite exporter TauE/SafE family protein [Hyunsoonleella aquatilis]